MHGEFCMDHTYPGDDEFPIQTPEDADTKYPNRVVQKGNNPGQAAAIGSCRTTVADERTAPRTPSEMAKRNERGVMLSSKARMKELFPTQGKTLKREAPEFPASLPAPGQPETAWKTTPSGHPTHPFTTTPEGDDSTGTIP